MLQDFNFKIVHRVGARHVNVNALSRNPIGLHDEDEDFGWRYKMRKRMLVWHRSGILCLESTYPHPLPDCSC
jgi:hypothetical protein